MGSPCAVPEPPPCEPTNVWVAPAQPLKHIPKIEWGSMCSWSLLCQRPAKSEVTGASGEALHASGEDQVMDALLKERCCGLILWLRQCLILELHLGCPQLKVFKTAHRLPVATDAQPTPCLCTVQLAKSWQKCSHGHCIGSQEETMMCCALHSSCPYHSTQRSHTVKLMVHPSCDLKRL